MTRPKILVTLDTGERPRKGVPFPIVWQKTAYARAVEGARATPILASPTSDAEVIGDLIALMDGLVITGGAFDIAPEAYGATASGVRLDAAKPERTTFELLLLRGALARGVPVLGICGGMQLLNIALGGTLLQDIRAEIPGALDHEQATSPALPDHPVEVVEGSKLAAIIGRAGRIQVNTTHHQAPARLGHGVNADGRSPDGVIEAISTAQPFVVGVQWHPELLDDDVSRALYGALARAASARV